MRAWLSKDIPEKAFSEHIPCIPLRKPITEPPFSLITSVGTSMKNEPLFDGEREKGEPKWADRTSRDSP
jgi:hypothetical protein